MTTIASYCDFRPGDVVSFSHEGKYTAGTIDSVADGIAWICLKPETRLVCVPVERLVYV